MSAIRFVSMRDSETEKILLNALKRLGIEVRIEQLESGQGGYCLLNEKPVVVIGDSAPISVRIEILLSTLRKLNSDEIYLPPSVRDLLEET